MNPERPQENQEPGELQPTEQQEPVLEIPEAESAATESSDEAKEKTEEELSPEIIEKIMEKVQDINQEGTAAHGIGYSDKVKNPSNREDSFLKNLEFLDVVLDTGLLAKFPYDLSERVLQGTPEERRVKSKKDWVRIKTIDPQKRKRMYQSSDGVYFHVKHPQQDEWNFSVPDNITITFDYEKLKKKLTGKNIYRRGTYDSKTPPEEAGEGAIKNRIAPRFLEASYLQHMEPKFVKLEKSLFGMNFPKSIK